MFWLVINPSVTPSWCQAHLCACDQIFVSSEIHVFTVLGTISDERLDLSYIK